jgi:hypothetical protein
MDLKKMGYECVYWIPMTHYRELQVLMNAVMHLLVAYETGELMT